MACNKSLSMNVGDPYHSSKKKVLANKFKSEEAKMMIRKSDQGTVLMKSSNVDGGKARG